MSSGMTVPAIGSCAARRATAAFTTTHNCCGWISVPAHVRHFLLSHKSGTRFHRLDCDIRVSVVDNDDRRARSQIVPEPVRGFGVDLIASAGQPAVECIQSCPPSAEAV